MVFISIRSAEFATDQTCVDLDPRIFVVRHFEYKQCRNLERWLYEKLVKLNIRDWIAFASIFNVLQHRAVLRLRIFYKQIAHEQYSIFTGTIGNNRKCNIANTQGRTSHFIKIRWTVIPGLLDPKRKANAETRMNSRFKVWQHRACCRWRRWMRKWWKILKPENCEEQNYSVHANALYGIKYLKNLTEPNLLEFMEAYPPEYLHRKNEIFPKADADHAATAWQTAVFAEKHWC